jgi:hypothetical protein
MDYGGSPDSPSPAGHGDPQGRGRHPERHRHLRGSGLAFPPHHSQRRLAQPRFSNDLLEGTGTIAFTSPDGGMTPGGRHCGPGPRLVQAYLDHTGALLIQGDLQAGQCATFALGRAFGTLKIDLGGRRRGPVRRAPRHRQPAGTQGPPSPRLRRGNFFPLRKEIGGADRDQTDDLVVANDALYQLSYCPESGRA